MGGHGRGGRAGREGGSEDGSVKGRKGGRTNLDGGIASAGLPFLLLTREGEGGIDDGQDKEERACAQQQLDGSCHGCLVVSAGWGGKAWTMLGLRCGWEEARMSLR